MKFTFHTAFVLSLLLLVPETGHAGWFDGVITRCGNGKTELFEQCDDGNTVSGDGCSSKCQIERIGPSAAREAIVADAVVKTPMEPLEGNCEDLIKESDRFDDVNPMDLKFYHACFYKSLVASPSVPSGLPSILVYAGIQNAGGHTLSSAHGITIQVNRPRADLDRVSYAVCRKAEWDENLVTRFSIGVPFDVPFSMDRDLALTVNPNRLFRAEYGENNKIVCTGFTSAPIFNPFSGDGCLIADQLTDGYTGTCPLIDETTTPPTP